MTRRRRSPNSSQKRSRNSKRSDGKPADVTYILEQGNIDQLRRVKKQTDALCRYYWDLYAALAYQRKNIEDQLHTTLNESCLRDFRFDRYQRAVKYRYSLHPLSTKGSTRDIGQRFNVGDINVNVPSFPALYIASDKDTALQETLGQISTEHQLLTPQELALTNPQSETIVSVSGQLDQVFDLRSSDKLDKFVGLIKDFAVPLQVIKQAKALGTEVSLVDTVERLYESVLDVDWRKLPRFFDVPSNSQIFGQLVYNAKIAGIVYLSKLTNKECLAIFPRNFQRSLSFVQLDDPPPDDKVPNKIDENNYAICDLTFEELC